MTPGIGPAAGPIGRALEFAEAQASLDALLRQPQVVVITGPAGIGKTTLWRATISAARARGFRTLETRAVGAEAQHAFGGLVDLLDPVIDEVLHDLPSVQRSALEVALYRRPAEERPLPELATSLGALAAVRAIAAERPLLVAVDDLQWLDGPSSRILEYIARRLGEARLGLLFAVRRDHADDRLPGAATAAPVRVRRIHVGPLPMDALDALLRSELRTQLHRPALAWIHAESTGNPFQALEIARALERTGTGADREGLAMSVATDDLVLARLRALPETTRWPLAAVAALARPSPDLIEAAHPGATAALDHAHTADVVDLESDRVRFTHPLLAAAAYGVLAPAERRALHARLAMVVADPEARAWHLALSSGEVSETVAAELETAARSARSRGAADTAAELLLRAAALTPPGDPDGRLRRTVAAAEDLIRAGDPPRARAVLEPAITASAPGPARADALRALADVRSSDDWEAKIRLLEEALGETGDAHALRSRILQDLSQARRHTMRDVPGQLALALEAVAEAEAGEDPVALCSAYLATLLAQGDSGMPLDEALLDRAMALAPRMEHLRVLYWPGFIRAMANASRDRLDDAAREFTELRHRATELGDWDSLPLITEELARVQVRRGIWDDARRLTSEADAGARQTGQSLTLSYALLARATLAIAAGDEATAQGCLDEGRALAHAIGARRAERQHQAALGSLSLSVGHSRRAEELLGDAARALLDEGFVAETSEPLLWAEALVLLGRPDEARPHVERVAALAARVGRPSTLAVAARMRGIIATSQGDERAAMEAFAEALAAHGVVEEPFERARTLLAHGEALRRFRRRGQARASLAAALREFQTLGARRWEDRAASELARTGHRDTGSQLTTTEEQVARLVAEGRTNREVAEALFMSPHTVEAHLTRIYRSLGIRGRTELARALPDRPSDLAATDEGSG